MSPVLVGAADAPLRLVLLHPAGGSALSLAALAHAEPDLCRSALVELPGRGARSAEPFASDYRAAVDDLLAVTADLLDRPTVLFGHSLGGNLAHSLTCALPDRSRALVRAVVVSGALAPADLRRTAGRPRPATEDPVLLADEALSRSYRSDVLPAGPLPEYHIWQGDRDEHLPADHVEAWARHLRTRPAEAVFPGGHDYHVTAAAAVRTRLRALLHRCADAVA
jgi:surfactin synthase thioesterase subunit